MVVDSIKKILHYFINSKELKKTQPMMSTAVAPNDDVQSLYTIVENCLKDNVSRFYSAILHTFITLKTRCYDIYLFFIWLIIFRLFRRVNMCHTYKLSFYFFSQ